MIAMTLLTDDSPSFSPPTWPPPEPAGHDLDPGPARRSRRSAWIASVAAVVAIAGGTAGGYVAGDHHSASANPPGKPPAVTAQPNAATPAVATSAAKTDVSGLIASTLPGVVSITDQMSGSTAAGTGFVVSTDGQIATNAHVVADATNIEVTFQDGSKAAATILGIDRTDDLAVIKVDKTGLDALSLGTSADLKMGMPVVAIGNALDLTGVPTATEGIVSALNRSIDTQDGEHLSHLIQTDAAINPGNSGGPLLTLDGKVVGINSAGSQAAQNIGFAIAVDTARPIIQQLQQGKTITTAYLGVSVTPVDPVVAQQNGLAVDHGMLVVDVASGTAAKAAGIQPGDVIVSINNTATNDNGTLGDVIKAAGAGTTVHVTINRNGTTKTLDATLSSHPA
jgi:S1-C subfamily serine protease